MKKTHKFKALANVSPTVATSSTMSDAARRLGVNRSTVHRWIKAGKCPTPAGRSSAGPPARKQSPKGWARSIRRRYELDATEQTLVSLAAAALTIAEDRTVKVETRLAAMGRFQTLVRQLNLESPHGEVEAPSVGAFLRRVAG